MKEDIKETLISFQTAKLAKEIGIKYNDSYSDSFNSILPYLEDGSRRIDFNYDGEYYAACTQSLLQKYLREEYNIIIEIQFDTISYGYRIFNPFKVSNYFTDWKYDKWEYEEALEEGLYNGLQLIK